MTHFGEVARALRERLRRVAQRIGVEPVYLSKIERGEVPPPDEAGGL